MGNSPGNLRVSTQRHVAKQGNSSRQEHQKTQIGKLCQRVSFGACVLLAGQSREASGGQDLVREVSAPGSALAKK